MRRPRRATTLGMMGFALLAPLALASNRQAAEKQAPAKVPGQTVIKAPTAEPTPAAAGGSFDAKDCKACHEPAVTQMEHTKHGGLEQSCATCHDRAKAMEHSAGQAEGKGTLMPSLKSAKAKDINPTCLGCHEKNNQASWMGGMHDRKQVACTNCHSMHSAKSVKGQLKMVNDTETCVTCHKAERSQLLRTAHHPVREGKMGCTSCHNPHDGSRPKMLQAESVNELCYKCHTEKRGPFLYEHAPVREDCTSCHAPHGSNHERMLIAKPPFLCQRCHYSAHGITGDLSNTAAGAPTAPPPVGGVTQTTRSSREQERSCKQCHLAIHGSNHPSGNFFLR